MKILIENYNTVTSTEATYLHNCFLQAGVEASMWNREEKIPVFDLFDQVDPEVFITRYDRLTPEVIKRLGKGKCQLVLNVSGIDNNSATNLEEELAAANINVGFFFYNRVKPVGLKTKCVELMPGADIFLGFTKPSARQIPWATISESPVEMEEAIEVYHNISTSPNYSGDLQLDLPTLAQKLSLYRNVRLHGDSDYVLGQLFLDCAIRTQGKATIKMTEENQPDVMSFFKRILPDLPEGDQASVYIKSTIISKHSCFNRAERLAGQLGMDEAVKNLRLIQDSMRNQMREEKVSENS